jgi:hypothetical protein
MTTPPVQPPIPASFTLSVSTGGFPSPPASLAMEARRVAEMIEKLPAVCYANGTVPLLQQAGVECFFVHVRGMVEFLGIHTDSRDRSAKDILASWSPPSSSGPDASTWTKLNDHWVTASKHVMHFSQLRTKQDNGTQVRVPVEQADLEAIANDVLALWDRFSNEVASANLMGSLQQPKRGSFTTWNFDGSLQNQSNLNPRGVHLRGEHVLAATQGLLAGIPSKFATLLRSLWRG